MKPKTKVSVWVRAGVVMLAAALIVSQKAQKPRILILHSYHTDYPWVVQINEGIRRVFDGHHDIALRYHYMDLKNHMDEDFKRTAASTAHRTIRKWKPDVIVISDDLGQQLVGQRYVNDSTIQIVFCGVNGETRVYGYEGAGNVTGILERKPLSAIRETLMMVARAKGFRPEKSGGDHPRVVFVCDASDSVTAELAELNAFDWSPLAWCPPVRVSRFGEWKRAVREANGYADMILVSDYREFRLPSGEKEPVPPSEIMGWTEKNSGIPILGMSLVNVADGGMISVFTSGYEQGEVAGGMALAIARGERAGDMEVQRTRQFLISVKKSAMEQRDLPIPTIYESFARATDNYYD